MLFFCCRQVMGSASDAHDSASQAADQASAGLSHAQKVAAERAQQVRDAGGEYAASAQETAEQARQQGESTWQKVKDTAAHAYEKVRWGCYPEVLVFDGVPPSRAHLHLPESQEALDRTDVGGSSLSCS
jgi:hypothetical protein